MIQPSLFPVDHLSTDMLDKPKFGRMECELSIKSWHRDGSRRMMQMLDEYGSDEPPKIKVYSFTAPKSSGLMKTYHRPYDSKQTFRDIWSLEISVPSAGPDDGVVLLNEWLKGKKYNEDDEAAAAWIAANAAAMNNSRRYWNAIKQDEILKELEYKIHRAMIRRDIAITEAIENRYITDTQERNELALQFGATLEDLGLNT